MGGPRDLDARRSFGGQSFRKRKGGRHPEKDFLLLLLTPFLATPACPGPVLLIRLLISLMKGLGQLRPKDLVP